MGLNQQVYMLHLPQTRSYVPMLVPNQRAGKHNCTRQSGMYVSVAPDQQPCFYMLHTSTISKHVCYSFNCIRPFAMSFTVEPNKQTSINICYSNIQPSALTVELALDQYSSNGCFNCTEPADLYFTATSNQQSRW